MVLVYTMAIHLHSFRSRSYRGQGHFFRVLCLSAISTSHNFLTVPWNDLKLGRWEGSPNAHKVQLLFLKKADLLSLKATSCVETSISHHVSTVTWSDLKLGT